MKNRTSIASFSSKVTREWLHEYKVLADAELHTFANTVRSNDELIIALYQLFENDDELQEVLDPVCHQLFDFYRSDLKELKRFTLEFVPTLILAYLAGVSNNDKKRCGGMEACLLGIYNLEVTEKDGRPKVERFTIPTIACPSIYHEPPSLATLALTESALITFHGDEHVVINHGPLPQVECISAQNRMTVLSQVMSCYYRDIASMSPRSHQKLCKMASRLTTVGFNSQPVSEIGESVEINDVTSSTSSLSSSSRSNDFPLAESTSGSSFARTDSRKSSSLRDSLKRESMRKNAHFVQERRITLNSTFLVELLNSVYFVMFNGHARLGIQSVEDIHKRACYHLWSDVLLVTNAIQNSMEYHPSGQPMEGPMGMSIALSPTTSNPSFTKHAITNASFRAKKLPDDIDVPESPDGEVVPPPPAYDELNNQDKPDTSGVEKNKSHMFSKPLKSIMKSGKDKMAMKMTRKDSDLKRKDVKDHTDGSHSPRNSTINPIPTSQSLNISQSIGNGAVDLENITVSVVRSSSKTKVDQIELRNIISDSDAGHRRTSSFPEGGFTSEKPVVLDSDVTKPLLRPGLGEQKHPNDSEEDGYSTNL